MIMKNATEKKASGNIDPHWDVEMAVAVMQDPHADPKTWSDAVSWLLVNGPAELRELIQQASHHATSAHFPGLKPKGYTADGEPVYDIKALAKHLGISEEEAGKRLSDMQTEAGVRTLFQPDETHNIH
jgi:hypothetical protein